MSPMQQHVHVGLLTGLATISTLIVFGFGSKWALSKRPQSPVLQGLVALH